MSVDIEPCLPRNPRILVIDDDLLVRRTIVRILRGAGYETLVAENGSLGLDLFERERPDLVITDIIMPEKEGIETIRAIRQLSPEAKIIAMSGGGRTGNADFLAMAGKLGASDTLHKPFGAAQLVASVARWLAKPETATGADCANGGTA